MKETKFKQTEVGMIPWDWMVSFLGNVGTVKMCKRVMKYQTSEKGDIPFYKIGTFGKEPDAYISKDLYLYLRNKYSFPQKGDVLISAAGTIGRTVVYDGKDAFFQDSNIVWLEHDESILTNQYLYFLYQVVEWKTENGGVVSRLYNDNFKITPVAIPTSKEEQQRIANALSDVDSLISNLEKLIAKKKNIKQGAMQQLLTGRKRLPGFGPGKTKDERRETKEKQLLKNSSSACHCEEQSDAAIQNNFKMTELGPIPSDWDVKSLGSITQNCSYGVGAEAVPFKGGEKYIRITDIDDDSHRFTPEPLMSPSFYEEKHIVEENDLLIARTGASVGKTYLYNKGDGKLVFAGFLIKMNVNGADSKFVFYNTLTKYYQDWIVSESARTGQPGINLQQMKTLKMAFPSSKAEQTAIANVLSDMDSEIQTLEIKLAKYRKLKTGMMQQLLTGKIRLMD